MQEFMKSAFTIILMSFTLEAIVTYIRTWFVDNHFQWQQAATCVGGILLALLSGSDLFALLDVKFAVPYVGMVLTGILGSRGSNFVWDFITKAFNIKDGQLFVTETTGDEEKG